MKKTTKILLVLAAVVAMTIGAVSTVMAADEFPVIATWGGDATNGYTAVDTNGEEIVRGWATSDGFWYWFDSSKMVVNTFITYKEDIYYLDKNGHMACGGWIEFIGDGTDAAKVNAVDKYDDARTYANITLIEGFGNAFKIATTDAAGDPLFTGLFQNGSVNKTVWCYFDEHGVMANHEWIQNKGDQWYFVYGPYCVMGDYKVAIDLGETGADKWLVQDNEGFYGFGNDGAELFGWIKHVVNNNDGTNGSQFDKDTPYQDDKAGTAATTKEWYVYYHTNGRLVNTTSADPKDPNLVAPTAKDVYEGWEKIDGHWCYFIEDDITGMKLLQDTVLFDCDTDDQGKLDADGNKGTFYLDANGYMWTGIKTFTKNVAQKTWDEANTSSTSIEFKVATAHDGVFCFDTETGKMLDGVQGNYYYKDFTDDTTDKLFPVVSADITNNGVFALDDETASLIELDGQRVTAKNYFLVITDINDIDGDNNKTETVVLYFESGRWQKNQGITFGEVTIAIDAKGLVDLGTADITVDNFAYKHNALKITLTGAAADGTDIVINGVERK
ncbi:MAG: hypothetical protein E7261_02465 [Lachnospiraceae bacterium]|nr:hypothetical protein [Lachnospiraceae bacterium]